jgi:hypothetical protein
MKVQQIIGSKVYTGEGDCGCGAETDLFIVEYDDDFGDMLGYPSLLQCRKCMTAAQSEITWLSSL